MGLGLGLQLAGHGLPQVTHAVGQRLQQHDAGKYFHLLLVNVLRGNPLKTSEEWKGRDFGYAQDKLGEEFDSVEGGPHQPLLAGPGTDDSLIYVVYHPSQCLPEFIVTYTENGS